MLMGSMLAYQYCTLGTIVVIGAMCPLLTLPVEVAVFRRNKMFVTWHTIGSMVMTVVGVALYGMFQGQLRGQLIGIVAMVAKTLINVYYQTRMRYLMVEDPVDINDEGMMLYNNGIALLATLVTVLALNEQSGLAETTSALSQWEWTWIWASCIFCYSISYFSFRCQRVVSATSFHILGNVAKIVVVLFGWVVLKENYNLKSACAVAIALCGAGWYSWDRVMEEPRKEATIENYVPLGDDDAHLSTYIKGRSGSLSLHSSLGAGGYAKLKDSELQLPKKVCFFWKRGICQRQNCPNLHSELYQQENLSRTTSATTGSSPGPTAPVEVKIEKFQKYDAETLAYFGVDKQGKTLEAPAKANGSSSITEAAPEKSKKKKKKKKTKFKKKVPKYSTATIKLLIKH
eukprot:CAMPEP_0114528304 /NCGR_PEP_ID=MMETSP0109-20121206/24131_1 /TAXON_ID=29199 /ORGANISM="Chlorarachnion reptans, Strain CCCM449" /LENGTH=400 /DNA_ID=CAMNT_0001710433 /DNA_START=399 /DNA_END=1601 /DNA_ORIENTATION=+